MNEYMIHTFNYLSDPAPPLSNEITASLHLKNDLFYMECCSELILSGYEGGIYQAIKFPPLYLALSVFVCLAVV